MKLNVPCDARLRRASLASTAIPWGCIKTSYFNVNKQTLKICFVSYTERKKDTSSGNQTPGCVLPSSIATTKAAVETPTALQTQEIKVFKVMHCVNR